MAFIVMEGLDGSGKSTQLRMLKEYLSKHSIDHFFLHFPRTDAPVFGELIARFLRGELGHIHEVDPYLVALLYAGDRRDAAPLLREQLAAGRLVIVDRYVWSNIAFQCAKVEDPAARARLRDWILKMEYEHFAIPRPDLNLFLDVPSSFTAGSLQSRQGDDRRYLEGHQDIHEADLSFQQKVREVYLSYSAPEKDCVTLACYDEEERMLPPETIFEKVLSTLRERKILPVK